MDESLQPPQPEYISIASGNGMYESLELPYSTPISIVLGKEAAPYHDQLTTLAQQIERDSFRLQSDPTLRLAASDGSKIDVSLERLHDDAGNPESFVVRVTDEQVTENLLLIHGSLLAGKDLTDHSDDMINEAQLKYYVGLLYLMHEKTKQRMN